MKKLFFFLTFFLASFITIAQTSDDPKLNDRLSTYMRLNRELKFEALMDYIHPSLFKIATRKQMVDAFKSVFNNSQMKMQIDSTHVTAISKSFRHKTALFKKVDYYMELTLQFNDTAVYKKEGFIDAMTAALNKGFPLSNVAFNANRQAFEIKGLSKMLAIKDTDAAKWFFLGIDADKAAMMRQLLPKEVISHFKLL
jgi:hypothetical protein